MRFTRRWFKYLFVIAALAMLFVFPASADTNPAAAVKMQGGNAILYNPANQQVYENLKGFQEVPQGSGFYYYFKSNNGVVYNSGRFTEGGKTYYAYEDGHLAIGFTEIGNKAWYFMKDGTLARHSIIKADSNIFYYAGKNGKLKMGLKKVNGAYYYFDPASYQMQFGWVKLSTGMLYMKGAGNQIGQAVIGWMTLDGKKYYFNKKGLMVHGWLTLNGKKYYLDPETGACYTGKKTIEGKEYDSGTTGAMVDPAATATGPWIVKVNQSTCTVTIYRGTTPVKAFCCSVGLNNATPDGTFSILDHLRWHELMGPSWGQWCPLRVQSGAVPNPGRLFSFSSKTGIDKRAVSL